MQIKSVNAGHVPVKVVAGAPTVNDIVMKFDIKDLLSDEGATYFSMLRGAFAYFFDDPKRKHNHVMVLYGKNKAKVMRVNDLIIHLILWRVNVVFNIPFDESDFYNLSNPTNKMFVKLIDTVTKKAIAHENGVTPSICECIASIKELFSMLAEGNSFIVCNTISIYDTLQFRKRNKKFRDLTDTVLDPSKSIKELEVELKQCEKDLVKVIMEDDKNCYAPYIRSGRVKSGQLTQCLCAVGTRPDIDKTILPLPIQRSYLRGFQNAAEYFMESVTARDAMMTKNDSLPRSGFLSRKINRLTSTIRINYKNADCGTQHYLIYTVENEDYLKMIEGKNYLDPETGKLKEVKASDKHLIGQTIKLRSFIFCAEKDGCVCKACVGESIANRLAGTRLGCLPSIKSINPLSQKALSAKHMLGTKSITITNEALIKYCVNDGVDIYIKPEYANSRKIFLVVSSDDVEELMNSSVLDTEDSTVDARIDLSYVAIRDNGMEYPIENEGMSVALADNIVENKNLFQTDPENPDFTLIPIAKVENDTPLLSIVLDTEEITKYLNTFIGTVDRISINRFHTADELMKEMNRIIYESGFVNRIIHFESIIRSMVRAADNDLILPDFSIKDVPYQILKVSTAIEHKDMYTALSFQGLRRLFKDLSMQRRYGKSLYDSFFLISELY